MSQSAAWWRMLVLATVVLCIVLAVGASGQGGSKPAGGFGTVDFQKITGEYKEKAVVEADIRGLRDKYDARLARRANMPDLPESDQIALDGLYDKGTGATEADKTQIREIETRGQQLAAEFRALSEKKDLTEAEKTKLQDAAKVRAGTQERFTALQEDLTTKLREYGGQKEDTLMKAIRAAVAKVAEQKGLAIVFRTEVALYAGTDVTQPVLDALNKGK